MNTLVIKAICRRIEARYGSNRLAAIAADVSGGVWSNYCSDDHPETTIPLHRLFLVANAEERAIFAKLLMGEEYDAPECVETEAQETTEAAAEMQKVVRILKKDGLTPRDRKIIRQHGLAVQEQAADVIRAAGAHA